jgi:sulfate-transporting ATPase
VALVLTLLATPDGQAAEIARLLGRLRGRLPHLARWSSRMRRIPVASSPPGPSANGAVPQVPNRGAMAVEGITVRLGGNVIIDDVSLRVAPGEVVGLIGPNGAGKTTVIDSISGFVSPTAGKIRIGERSLTRMAAHRRVRCGVARSFQSLELFEDLTVLENIYSACEKRDRVSYLVDLVAPRRTEVPHIVWHALAQCRLIDKLERHPGELSYGQRRLVAIVRAVATGAGIVLLDEPAAGLSHAEIDELSGLITWLARECGAGVLLVEHDVAMVMALCDRINVLEAGHLIASGEPADIRENQAVVTAYLGA